MQTTQVNAFKALVFSTQATLSELGQHVGSVARQLHADAVANQLDITGPVQWIYDGMDGNPHTRFALTIALPVSGQPSGETAFECQTLPTFKCIWLIHQGPWNQMHIPYKKLIDQAISQQLTLTHISRELYIHVDFENAQNNITLIQLGIS